MRPAAARARCPLVRFRQMPGALDPIGMFDSGAGGLAVLREVRRLLPGEDIIYYADTAQFPYGPKPAEEIRGRSFAITRELLARGAKAIVIACNTATSAAIGPLREAFAVPFVGMEPALKPAAARTRSGVVALLVTPGTARGEKLASLIGRYGAGADVRVIEAPGLADCVEAGDLDGAETAAMLRRYADAVRESGADALALGCTHYAFLRPAFQRLLGDAVDVIEPSEAVARQVQRVLDERSLLNVRGDGGSVLYLTSGDEAAFAAVRARLMDGPVAAKERA